MAGFGRSNSLSINTGAGAGAGSGSSSLFGSSTANTTAQNAPAAQPQSSGGLFGGTLNKPATPAPSTGGLFGGAAQPKPSLFGSSTQQPATSSTPSLFANTASQQQQQQQQPTQSLFGSTLQPQPQQQNSLFGAMSSQPAPAPLGSSTLGAGVQPVQMTLESIRGTTRFNDLHPDLQNLVQMFDDGIQRKIGYCSQIRETLPRNENDIATIAPDVAYIDNFLSTIETGLDNDSTNIAYLKELVKKDAADATLSFRAIENQRLPAQFHYRNSANLTAATAKAPVAKPSDAEDPTKPVDLMEYFVRRTDDLDRTLDVYQRQIREIEAHLRTMEAGTVEKAQQLTGSRNAPRDQRRELVEALKAIEGAILDSAKKVGQVRDQVTQQTMGNVGAALL